VSNLGTNSILEHVKMRGMNVMVAVASLLLVGGVFAADDGSTPPDMAKPIQVFILMGQSNMVGAGKVGADGKGGAAGSLEEAVKQNKKYPYLVDANGNWATRNDVRYVRVMQGKGPGRMQLFNNEPMTVAKCKTIGPEFGIAKQLGDATTSPVMILKSCIGNRSLGWDLLPPGSEPYQFNGKVEPGYWGTAENPKGTGTKPAEGWYAGKQYDDDVSYAKNVLMNLNTYYPGARGFEIAGFFFWQGEKDCGNPAHAARYEQNLVNFIKQLRKDFNAPNAKFVLGTLGEAKTGSGGATGQVLSAHMAVDSRSGKYPEFKGNVATVYTHPMAQGGSGNGHYGGKAEVYMDVGEAMGKTMVLLLEANAGPAGKGPRGKSTPKKK
jgi:hypothetical protein